MIEHGLSFLFTVLLWWLSTGVVLLLCTLPRRTFGWSLLGGALMLGAAIYGLVESAGAMTTMNAYVAFLSAVGIWGGLEMSFLMGYVTGPRKTPCPVGATGFRRFRLAVETLVYHELAIALTALAVMALTWGAANQTGTLAFLILMVMRISAKLNIFLGVPNLTDDLLPKHLSYLKSYFRKCRVNQLFPVSIFGGVMLALALAQRALQADGGEAIAAALLLALTSLAILEHFFMVMPVPDGVLWSWATSMGAAKPIEKGLP